MIEDLFSKFRSCVLRMSVPNGRSISEGLSSFSYMYTFDTINHLFGVSNVYISFWRNAVISLFVLRPLYKKDDCVFCGQETIKWFSFHRFSTPVLSLNKILVRLVWFVRVLNHATCIFRNNLKTHVRLRCFRKKNLIYPYFETLLRSTALFGPYAMLLESFRSELAANL